MIRNSNLMLRNQIEDKMKNLTFHTVVNKVFLGALPIDKSEMTRENTLALSTYSLRALESAGGFNLLEKALENTADPYKHLFLKEIYDVCTESAKEVAYRVAKEDMDLSDIDVKSSPVDDDGDDNQESGPMPDSDDPEMKETSEKDDTSIDDIKAPDDTKPVHVKPQIIRQGIPFKDLIADAKMTDAEYGRFVDKMGKLDLPEVSKMINKRVETAMKAEKETYQMIDESDQKLRDAISNKSEDEGDSLTEDQADEIKESMLYVPLKHKAREHVSLISKLQQAAIESITMTENVNYDVPDPKMLLAITENFTFDDIFSHTEPTLEQQLDSIIAYTKNKTATEGFGCPIHEGVVLGSAIATIIYTLLQTMHSMNLVCVTPAMVRGCCDKPSPYQLGTPHHHGDINVGVKAALEKNNRKVSKCKYAADVESAIDELTRIRSKVYTARDNGYPVSEELVRGIENSIETALKKKSSLEAASESTLSYGGSNRGFEIDALAMNSIARTFRNTPVDHIEFRCTEGASNVNVIGLKDGRDVKNTSYVIESTIDVPTANYLKAIVMHSKLPELKYGNNRPSITTMIDGKRTTIIA